VGTITNKLNAVLSSKEAIQSAISAKNVNMSDNPPLSQYAARIGDISGGAVVDAERRIAAFGAVGTFTWTVPDGVYSIIIEGIGAGGGGGQGGKSGHYSSATSAYKGGAGGGSGQGGSRCMFRLAVQPGDVISATIGTGGAGAAARTGLPTSSGSANTVGGNFGSSGTATTIYLNGVLTATLPGGVYGNGGSAAYASGSDDVIPGGQGGFSSVVPSITGAQTVYYAVSGASGAFGGDGIDNDGVGTGGGVYLRVSSKTALPSLSYKSYNGLYIPTLNDWRGDGGDGTSGINLYDTISGSYAGLQGAVVIFF
jgi:hypothetical protein